MHYFKSYNTVVVITCLLLIFISLDFSNQDNQYFIFFDTYSENVSKIILLVILFFNALILIKNYCLKTFNGISDIRNNKVLLTLMYVSIITKISVFGLLYVTAFEKDPSVIEFNIDSIPVFYISHLVVFYTFVCYFFYWAYHQIVEKPEHNHWILNYLSSIERKNLKVYKIDNKITHLTTGKLFLDELKNIVKIKDTTINLKTFQHYLEIKNCKLNELNNDDILIMKMLSI